MTMTRRRFGVRFIEEEEDDVEGVKLAINRLRMPLVEVLEEEDDSDDGLIRFCLES